MVWAVKFSEPSFSYHAILSSVKEAERTSRSPSPSTSAAYTETAAAAAVVRMFCPSNVPDPAAEAAANCHAYGVRAVPPLLCTPPLAVTVTTSPGRKSAVGLKARLLVVGKEKAPARSPVWLPRTVNVVAETVPWFTSALNVASTLALWAALVVPWSGVSSVRVKEAATCSYHAILSSLKDAERTSRSPSPSTSAAYTENAPSAAVVISCAVKLSAPSFSYHAILLPNCKAERTSISPSPSTSAAYTDRAPLAAVVRVCAVKFSAPSFSYHAILLSNNEADSTSISPSPSTSATYTEVAPSAAVVISWAVKFSAPSFSYHTTLLSKREADSTSRSPSPSTSAAYTDRAPLAAVVISCAVKLSAPSFSYHAILLSLTDAERTSRSPSPSTSAAYTENAPSAAVVRVWAVKFSEPSFSYHTILWSLADAESTSILPSPSTSAAYTEVAPSTAVVRVWAVKFSEPSFSYHAILSSLKAAESTSISPSPSTSAAYTENAPSAAVVRAVSPPNVPDPAAGAAANCQLYGVSAVPPLLCTPPLAVTVTTSPGRKSAVGLKARLLVVGKENAPGRSPVWLPRTVNVVAETVPWFTSALNVASTLALWAAFVVPWSGVSLVRVSRLLSNRKARSKSSETSKLR